LQLDIKTKQKLIEKAEEVKANSQKLVISREIRRYKVDELKQRALLEAALVQQTKSKNVIQPKKLITSEIRRYTLDEVKQRSLLEAALQQQMKTKDFKIKMQKEKSKTALENASRMKMKLSEIGEVRQRSLFESTLEQNNKAKNFATKINMEKLKAVLDETARIKMELGANTEAKQRTIFESKLLQDAQIRYWNSPQAKAERRAANVVEARRQPKSPEEEKVIASRYGAMELEERAYQILYDLGMIEETPDPDSADYDSLIDEDIIIESTA